MRRLAAALAAAAALALAGPAAAAPLKPSVDPFYKPAAGYEAAAPGTVLRSRKVDIAALGIPLPFFKGYQVLYRTNDAHDQPVATVATIMVPARPAPAGGRPLVSYQPATDSLTTADFPSYKLQLGTEVEAAMMLLPLLLHNTAVVVSDYEGPKAQWIAALMAGHAVLDGVRAATHYAPAGLTPNTKVGLWGYSGGGQATASASELQATYAPELNVKGAAHGGAPYDLPTTIAHNDGGLFSGVLLGATVGLGRAYPEMGLDTVFNAAGKRMQSDIGDEGIFSFAPKYPLKHLADYTDVPDPVDLPQIKSVIEKNNLGLHTPAHPVFLYHGIIDEVNPISEADGLFEKYCDGGGTVDYHRELIGEHVVTTVLSAPAAAQFLADRFAGKPVPDDC
jgi:hypothetical protein